MDDNKNVNLPEEEDEVLVLTLTDENGEDRDFQLIGRHEMNGNTYIALLPVTDDDEDSDVLEYEIYRLESDGDEEILTSIDDDDEFDNISDYFNDLFSQEIDYDN